MTTGVDVGLVPTRAETLAIATIVTAPCCWKKKLPLSEPAVEMASGEESAIVTETRTYGPAGKLSVVEPNVSLIAVELVLTWIEPPNVPVAKPVIASVTPSGGTSMLAATPLAPITSWPDAPAIVT